LLLKLLRFYVWYYFDFFNNITRKMGSLILKIEKNKIHFIPNWKLILKRNIYYKLVLLKDKRVLTEKNT
jgi:hypothetical protein